MKVRAAVLERVGEPLVVDEVELDGPRAGEVLVRIAATGLCHSDLHVMDGGFRKRMPVLLGHEATGTVCELGPGVSGLAEGSRVVLSFVPACGSCPSCRAGRPNLCALSAEMTGRGTLWDGTSRLRFRGGPLHHFNFVSSFAEYAVVPAAGAIPIDDETPLDAAALLGCAVTTGVCAVTHTARVRPGAGVAVWGCGGVGLNVVQGARIAGAGAIVAVDPLPARLELARRLGATALVRAGEEDVVAAVRALTDGGPEHAFEASGRAECIAEAWKAVRPGGTVTVVGIVPRGRKLEIDPWLFLQEKTLAGCYYGSARLAVDVPRLLALHHQGSLELGALVSDRIPLEDINEGFERLRRGEGARTLVVFDGAG